MLKLFVFAVVLLFLSFPITILFLYFFCEDIPKEMPAKAAPAARVAPQRTAASYQDPSVLWNIAKTSSSFRVQRYGVVRSQDKLNATGNFRRDDGIFAPRKNQPVSYQRGTVKVGAGKDAKTKNVIVQYTRSSTDRLRKSIVATTNGKALAKGVRKLKKIGRVAPFAAIRAKRVAASLGRSYRKPKATTAAKAKKE